MGADTGYVVLIAGAHVLTLLILLGLFAGGRPVARQRLMAMTFRSAVWAAIAWVGRARVTR